YGQIAVLHFYRQVGQRRDDVDPQIVELGAAARAVPDVHGGRVNVASTAIANCLVGQHFDAIVVATGERAVDHLKGGCVIEPVRDDVEAVTGVGGAGRGAWWPGICGIPSSD